jgi:hypothetical protein
VMKCLDASDTHALWAKGNKRNEKSSEMFSEPSQVYIDLLRFLLVLKTVRRIFIMLNWSFFLSFFSFIMFCAHLSMSETVGVKRLSSL